MYMFVIAFSILKATYKTLQIPINVAYKMIAKFDNNFEMLIAKLRFWAGSLFIKTEAKSQLTSNNDSREDLKVAHHDFSKYEDD